MKISKSKIISQVPDELSSALDEVHGEENWKMTLRKSSIAKAVPGDILLFSYEKEKQVRKLLVVRTSKTQTGKYMSSLGNRLICCFELDLSISTLALVINKLYKNQNLSSYRRYKKSLTSFFGGSKFKTFKTSEINNLYEVNVRTKVD
jgi:hypothetical protein